MLLILVDERLADHIPSLTKPSRNTGGKRPKVMAATPNPVSLTIAKSLEGVGTHQGVSSSKGPSPSR